MNEGPEFSVSAKRVGRTRGLFVGDSVAEGSGAAVANEREDVDKDEGRKTLNGEGEEVPWRQRNLVTEDAIALVVLLRLNDGADVLDSSQQF